jgi:hypothetical protein
VAKLDLFLLRVATTRALRWSNSVKGRARILKEKEERNASPVSAFCSAKDRPSRKLFIPPLWLGNLNFRSRISDREREWERLFAANETHARVFYFVARHALQDRFSPPRSGSRIRIYFGNPRPEGNRTTIRRRTRGITKEVSSIRMRICSAKGEANRRQSLPSFTVYDSIPFAQMYTIESIRILRIYRTYSSLQSK